MLPNVSIKKLDGQTGAVRPGSTGILAIIAPSASGPVNAPATFSRQDLMLATVGGGPGVEFGAYVMAVAENPVLFIRPLTSTAAAYGAITSHIAGTCVVTAGSTSPTDDFNPTVNVVNGGTVGTTGITYTYNLDGNNPSAVQALGTATTLSIPGSGVSYALGAGTLLAGDSWGGPTTHARMTDADLAVSLEALRVTRLPWEGVLIDEEVGTGTIALVDTWLSAREAEGRFRFFAINTRHKLLPVPETETEGAYAAAMGTLVASMSSIRGCVCADAGDLTSVVTGLTMPRPVSLGLAARAMEIPIGEDPAFKSRGPIAGFSIADSNQNPKWHDEELYPGLDDQRLVTFRSFDQEPGVFINNANLISPGGSDYVYLQHARTMNRACEIAYQVLTQQLSLGVGKKKPDAVTGLIYILEQDALRIEAMVNQAFALPMKDQVAGALFSIARDDDLSSNQGATVHGQVAISALAYIKKFAVTAKFVKGL